MSSRGSDTHQSVQYGCIRTNFQKDVKKVEVLYEMMQSGNYTVEISSHAASKVNTAGILKNALKEIHALGGDYVAILTNS